MTSKLLFHDVHAILIPENISKTRIDIMRQRLTEKGGTVVTSTSTKVTHIITAHQCLHQVLGFLKLDTLPPDCKVVSPDFIAKSIQHGCLEHSGCEVQFIEPALPKKTESVIRVLDSDEELSEAETEPLDDYEQQLMESMWSESQAATTETDNEFENPPSIYSEATNAEATSNSNQTERKKIIIPEALLRYMNASPNSSENKNQHITDEFTRLVKRAETEGNQWRIRSYKKAVKIISKLSFRIMSKEDVKGLKGIGKNMTLKIEEILRTGYSLKAHTIPEKFGPLEKFKNIYGVGEKIAEKFYTIGYRTLEDVKSKATLTRDQQLGIKYYDDFLQRIPRSECSKIAEFVTKMVHELDANLICRMMGSYLRGSETCGDVDFMITDPNGLPNEGLLESIVLKLKNVGFILENLSSPASEDGHERIWRGICKLAGVGIARRIDILIVPFDELGAATIYFTGNTEFNRCIRLLARKMGYSLNQHGLFRKGPNGEKTLVASKTEQEIFDILGVPWKPATERNI
ncbi:Nucleotidyltransferase [Rhizoclosmatium globosum]|uniref:DNA polymerase n=1 Tax=Rhizoclosmatium globosum TaxID=329046 RepID=A0A1Y2BXA2_9FUNG|nr:Nucleotidyltransferase [Rhizoclosmatium globosum]|eukprot:ORY39402.1 Nucleotidyltransferase [Rhizoclosmatium globosum]